MAKPNYQFEKRQRDLAKKQKKEEKRQQKLATKTSGAEAAPEGPNGDIPLLDRHGGDSVTVIPAIGTIRTLV